MEAVILFSDSARGVYIPQHFATNCDRAKLRNISDSDLQILADGEIERDDYWKIWSDVLDSAEFVSDSGDVYTLWQDGDLWALCFDRMTDEEKENFGFEI